MVKEIIPLAKREDIYILSPLPSVNYAAKIFVYTKLIVFWLE